MSHNLTVGDSGNTLENRNVASQKAIIQSQLIGLQKVHIENSRRQSFYQWKMMVKDIITQLFEALMGFCLLINIVICLFMYYMSQLTSMSQEQTLITKSMLNMKLLMTFFTVVCYVFAILSELTELKMIKNQSNFNHFVWLLVKQALLFLPHPSYWTHDITIFEGQNKIKVDDMLTVCVLLRVFRLFKLLLHGLSYYGTRSMRISSIFGNTKNSRMHYAIKCFLQQNQKSALILLFLVNLFIVGQLICIFQRDNPFIDSWLSSLYFSLISMSTVGYGQMTPSTKLGKFITVTLIIVGSVLSSLFIIYALKVLEFDEAEKTAYSLNQRILRREKQIQERKKFLKKAILFILDKKTDRIVVQPELKSHYLESKNEQYLEHKYEGSKFISLLQTLSQKQVLTHTMINIVLERLKNPINSANVMAKAGVHRRQDNEMMNKIDEKIFRKFRKNK